MVVKLCMMLIVKLKQFIIDPTYYMKVFHDSGAAQRTWILYDLGRHSTELHRAFPCIFYIT